MGYIPPPVPNWRHDPSLSSRSEFKRRFAFFRVECADGSKVFFEFYYKHYIVWDYVHTLPQDDKSRYLHTDFYENVSEADYIIRKLSGVL